MYLKSLEIHGFKSFANKIVFDFHNGITGIVGPNGSGKSNVADAVRWVLGEQSAKQLRGSSMQDVIFAGTEARKPLGYAYVAITLDNSDHQLPISYDEVTVARRVYRSGESEYLLNGSISRLKEISELFYDTGIGKEGYSIIGQGQIDRILSGKPEERRELFDEAAGIVKYKKRKNISQKKLDQERENLTRVNDILSELERQVGPLQKQAEKARIYLKKREELKGYDINMFLLDQASIRQQLAKVTEAGRIASDDLEETNQEYEEIRREYESLGEKLQELEDRISGTRERIADTTLNRSRLENRIALLREQIHTSEITDEHLTGRQEAIAAEHESRLEEQKEYEDRRTEAKANLEVWMGKEEAAQNKLQELQDTADRLSTIIDQGQKDLLGLVEGKASIKGKLQRLDTMLEQLNIRKASLNQRLLTSKSQGKDTTAALQEAERALGEITAEISALKSREIDLDNKNRQWKFKVKENQKNIEIIRENMLKDTTRLEGLKNLAERYEGYGNSTRRVMEQKKNNPGIVGVVSELISVEQKYETAIETALGGAIQNIVTEDEETAKKMIAFLKQNRYGRATFLPLDSVQPRSNPKNEQAMKEEGAIGIASDLVSYDSRFHRLASYLLGRILVVDTLDHATRIARKYRFSLNIVTLEGDSLNPGGSMTGGAFKNSSNLLGRNREIEKLEKEQKTLAEEQKKLKNRQEDLLTAQLLTQDELEELREQIQEKYLEQNTARMNLEAARKEKEEGENLYADLKAEDEAIRLEKDKISLERQEIQEKEVSSLERRAQLEEALKASQDKLEAANGAVSSQSSELQQIRLQIGRIRNALEFDEQNLLRIEQEIQKLTGEAESILLQAEESRQEIVNKNEEIEGITESLRLSAEEAEEQNAGLEKMQAEKDSTNEQYRGIFRRQEEISDRKNTLDKEVFRLNTQKERLEETESKAINYLWEEYELTPHQALELKSPTEETLPELKKKVAEIKDEMKKLGNVNVNAIEEYRDVNERYRFLKEQHDDLIRTEETLMGVIRQLDEGMRRQFLEKFAEIQKEFDRSFRELFGGGHGTLELVDSEDVLECGIRIIAQPPGKKLQNMMQLSGGEKALSAIALLFAIQALKPSPFCLLDEIEAALDDSNVDRFASYLGKLTANTQFIVITHRRGTMNAADRLYGITMQEKGVSTLVSVNLIDQDLED